MKTEGMNFLIPEPKNSEDFDFEKLKSDTNIETVCGLPVRIDKVLRDITGTMTIGISGTLNVRGAKLRGIWDCFGNPIDFKKTITFYTPAKLICSVESMFAGTTQAMFKLVSVQKITQQQSITN